MRFILLHQNNTTIDIFLKDIHAFIDMLEYSRHHESIKEFSAKVHQFKQFLYSYQNTNTIYSIIQSSITKDLRRKINAINIDYYKSTQASQCIEMLESEDKTISISKILSKDLSDLYANKAKEFQSIKPWSVKTLVCVESSSLSQTALYLSLSWLVEKIIALDSNTQSVILAKRLFSKMNITNVEFVESTPESFDYSWVDWVFIPNLVNNKKSVLKQITKTRNRQVTVIMQYALWAFRLLYQNLPPTTIDDYMFVTSHDASRTFSKRLSCKLLSV